MSKNPVNEFIKQLGSLDRSRSDREKFQDLLELAYCAFAKPTAPTPERADALEARYMSIVNRYQDKDTIRAYPDLIGMAWDAEKDGGVDFLGEASAQLNALNASQGQFFTPYSVSRMMAEMQLDDISTVIEREGYVTLLEPACGAGGMVLAASDVFEQKGFRLDQHLLVQAVDVSPLCFYMAFLQLTWRGVAANVVRGNSLSLETFESAWTLAAFQFHAHHGHLSFAKPSQTNPADNASPTKTPDPAPGAYTQLSLF